MWHKKWFHWICNWKNLQTRMHSSGMRTARLLTVSQHALHRRGCLPRGYLSRGVSTQGGWCLPGGGGIPACNGAKTPLWTDRHLWKHNIRKLRLQAVTNLKPCSKCAQLIQSLPQQLPVTLCYTKSFTLDWFEDAVFLYEENQFEL